MCRRIAAASHCFAMVRTGPSGYRAGSSYRGSEAIMRKDGDKLILEPAPSSLLELPASWDVLGPDEDFPEIDDPPPEPVDLDLP
jgi:hypothetical protein